MSKLDRWLPYLIVGVALALRLFHLWESADNPAFLAPLVDAQRHHRLAVEAIGESGFSHIFSWRRPFFYPLYLTTLYSVAGPSVLAAKLIQAFLGSLTCGLTYLLSRELFGRRAGVLASLLVAFNGPLVFWEAELLAAGWAAFWSVCLLLLFLRATEGKRVLTYFLLGLCGTCALMTRPSFLLFLLASTLWLAVTLLRESECPAWKVKRAAALALGFILIAGPTATFSHRMTGHFGILPASGTLNLYIGNNPNRCEILTVRPGREFRELDHQGGAGQSFGTQSEYFSRQVREFATKDPAGFAAGLAHKALQYANGREVPRNLDIYVFRQWSAFLTASVWKLGGFGFPWGILFPLACLGLLLRWREVTMPMLFFVALNPLMVVLVFVAGRYRIAAIPLLSILASLGILALFSWIRERHWQRAIQGVGLVAAITLLTNLLAPSCEELLDYEAEMYVFLAASSLDERQGKKAEQYARKALELDPHSVLARHQLARLYEWRGVIGKALEQYDQALRIEEDRSTYYLRGVAFTKLGDFKRAEEDFRKALSLDESFVEARLQLGRCQYELRDLDAARATMEEVLQRSTGKSAQQARSWLKKIDRAGP